MGYQAWALRYNLPVLRRSEAAAAPPASVLSADAVLSSSAVLEFVR